MGRVCCFGLRRVSGAECSQRGFTMLPLSSAFPSGVWQQGRGQKIQRCSSRLHRDEEAGFGSWAASWAGALQTLVVAYFLFIPRALILVLLIRMYLCSKTQDPLTDSPIFELWSTLELWQGGFSIGFWLCAGEEAGQASHLCTVLSTLSLCCQGRILNWGSPRVC